MLIIFVVLFSNPIFAEEPESVPEEINLVEEPEQEIHYVPAGNEITATVNSYLLPEPRFDACLVASRQLRESVAPGLDACTENFSVYKAQCSLSLDQYAGLLARAETDVDRLSKRLHFVETENSKLRFQRNVIIGAVGAVILTGVTAAVLVE